MSKEEVKISTEVEELGEKIKKFLSVDSTTGVATVEDDLYKNTLTNDLTYDLVTKVKKHDRAFIAASAKAFGELAIEAMASNKKLETSSVEIPMSRFDSVTHNIDRHKTYTNHLNGANATVERHGALISAYTNKGGKNSSAELKRVRTTLQELAAKKLK